MEKFNCNAFEISDPITELLKDGAVVPMYVSGSSMNPFLISRRDIIYLKSADDIALKTGHIVLFKRKDSSLVLHRIIKVLKDNRLIVNGDAQTWNEEISSDQVLGVVIEIQRKGKRFSTDSPYWRCLCTLWMILRPLRSIILRVIYKIKR